MLKQMNLFRGIVDIFPLIANIGIDAWTQEFECEFAETLDDIQ